MEISEQMASSGAVSFFPPLSGSAVRNGVDRSADGKIVESVVAKPQNKIRRGHGLDQALVPGKNPEPE